MHCWCFTQQLLLASPANFQLFMPGRFVVTVIDRLAKSMGEDPVSSNRITIRRPNKRPIKLSRSGYFKGYALPEPKAQGLVGGSGV